MATIFKTTSSGGDFFSPEFEILVCELRNSNLPSKNSNTGPTFSSSVSYGIWTLLIISKCIDFCNGDYIQEFECRNLRYTTFKSRIFKFFEGRFGFLNSRDFQNIWITWGLSKLRTFTWIFWKLFVNFVTVVSCDIYHNIIVIDASIPLYVL